MNIAPVETVITGKVYMVEMTSGETNSFQVLSETPTHYILSFSIDDSIEVFEKAKSEVAAIYDVKEWLSANNI